MRWLGWAAVVCLYGCAGSASTPEPKTTSPGTSRLTGEWIALSFAWPVGLTARVEYREETEAKSPELVSLVFRSSHRMRVEPAEEGIRVIHDEFSIEPVSSRARPPGSAQQQDPLETESGAQVGDLLPDMIVDRSGNLVRVTGTDQLRQEAVERMAKGTEQSPESRARLERLIAQTVSDAQLTERAERDWSALVSFWVGARLAVGVSSSPSASGGGSRQVTVTPRVPCDPGDRSSACVRIELESHPAPELTHTILLVTEPDRLVPHQLQIGNEIHGQMTRPDGKPERIDQRSLWSYHFTYANGS